MDTYLTCKDALEPVAREDLLRRAQAGEVTVLDVRPAAEYAAGHVPGAINIPLAQLEAALDAIDPASEVIAYCRGPYCVLAFDAVKLLRARGYSASRLQDGFPEWRRAGLPVVSAPSHDGDSYRSASLERN